MDDSKLMEAYAELRTLADAGHTPPRVREALLSLREHQAKLFVTTGDSSADAIAGAAGSGTAHAVASRLEPSNFLRELLAAGRALEWPKVLVLVHSVSPIEIEITSEMIARAADELMFWMETESRPTFAAERVLRAAMGLPQPTLDSI